MSQSLSIVYVHLVFSTKDRFPFLRAPELRHALHEYIGQTSKRIGNTPIIVGGVEDHVHVLARFGRSLSQAEWVKELKRVSSQWLNAKGGELRGFQWQGGYAVFSVSSSKLEQVHAYVSQQEFHHRKIGFQDELRALLRKHGAEWDERYLWE